MQDVQITESSQTYPTRKYTFSRENNNVGFVYINRPKKDILCLSTMAGCPIRCTFCDSGTSYFGPLSSQEINQMTDTIVAREQLPKQGRKLLFSFMGSGEPLLNSSNVIKSLKYLDRKYPGGFFSMSISGVGIDFLPKFIKNFDEYQLPKLQFSLHSPYDNERQQLIPSSPTLSKILPFLRQYHGESGIGIDLNYFLLDQFNDSEQHARDLATLANEDGFFLKINQYHDVGLGFRESESKDDFLGWLKSQGISPEVYSTDGVDIGAGCGQLKSRKIN